MKTKWMISVAVEVRPWYVDEEDGEQRYHDVFFVVATSPDGQVYAHKKLFHELHETFPPEARADMLADVVRLTQEEGKWNGPEESPHWNFHRIVYGSPAYCRDAPRLEAETELAERAAEVGSVAAYDSLPDVMKAALA